MSRTSRPEPTTRIPWERLVHDHDARVRLDADGFHVPVDAHAAFAETVAQVARTGGAIRVGLADPTHQPPEQAPIGPAGLQAMRELACVVLVAERGSGKTDALRAEWARLRRDGAVVAWLELGEVTSSADLHADAAGRGLLDPSAGGEVWVFLDGLDDAPMPLDAVGAALARLLRELARVHGSRLRVRASCRGPAWPALAGRFGSVARPHEVTLAPLSRDDVAVAARQHQVDPDAFLAMVRTRRVGALAARPVTLLPMLDQFAADRILPHRLDELFGHAAARLCTSPPGRDGQHSPAERVALAARLAAALTLGGRQAVATATRAPELGADLPLGELGGGASRPGWARSW